MCAGGEQSFALITLYWFSTVVASVRRSCAAPAFATEPFVPVNVERLFRGRLPARPDLRGKGREDNPPGAAWLLDGGRAWPAGATRASAAPIPEPNPEEQTLVTRTSTNGAGSLTPAAAPEQLNPVDRQPDRPPPASEVFGPPRGAAEISGAPLAGDRVKAHPYRATESECPGSRLRPSLGGEDV